MKRLYVNCPICGFIFPSGFCAESPIQLIGFSYLCNKCRSIVPCHPSEYLEKVGNEFDKAMKRAEVFALYPPKRMVMSGIIEKVLELDKEVRVNDGILIFSDRAFMRSKVED